MQNYSQQRTERKKSGNLNGRAGTGNKNGQGAECKNPLKPLQNHSVDFSHRHRAAFIGIIAAPDIAHFCFRTGDVTRGTILYNFSEIKHKREILIFQKKKRGQMMDIDKKINGKELTITVEGRLDTITAPQLEAELKRSVGDTERLIFDLSSLEYISSAGLRVLLSAQKVMNRQGEMIVRNANEMVMEVFEITGFVDILNIES